MNIIEVSGLNAYVRSILEEDKKLNNIFVSGEISNFIRHSHSGHLYFSLKDKKSAVRCVMFKTDALRVRFKINDGDKVLARGQVSIFESTGQYQLILRDIQQIGSGELNLSLIALKEKLENEGLFNPDHKKELPGFPVKIGVVTSKSGSVIEDIKNVLKRRFPIAKILLFSAGVQGEKAAEQLIKGIKELNKDNLADVIIIARGGGASEDLWVFNNEELARCIYNSNIPIVSAVGHETDYTICDLVADLRAPTPSAAAELVSPNIEDILLRVKYLSSKIDASIMLKLEFCRNKVDVLVNNKNFASPINRLKQSKLKLDYLSEILDNVYSFRLNEKYNLLSLVNEKLKMLNPSDILNRGYSIAYTRQNKILKDVASISEYDTIKLRLSNGNLICKVITKEEDI